MNKLTKVLLAILGGLEIIFSLLSPLLVVSLWVNLYDSPINWVWYTIGFAASLARAVKFGGWLK